MKVAFHRPFLSGRETDYVSRAIDNLALSGGSQFSKWVMEQLSAKLGGNKVFLTTSGTAALEMASILAGINAGDEVIMPSFTFVTTANAIVLRGARPVFVEVDQEDMNLDVELLSSVISERSRAVIPVHYAGLPCRMDRIVEIARDHRLKVIEDAAHALGACYLGVPAGTWGDYGCFSFHATKNITCGEGGALVVTDDEEARRAEVVWQKGTDRESFLRREVSFYSWQDVGSSFPPSEILVAFLVAQLQVADHIEARRREIWETYCRELAPLANRELLKIQHIPPESVSTYHIFYLLFSDQERREKVQNYLAKEEIETAFHYIPLHLSPMGRRLGYSPGDLPVTEKLAGSLLRLPIYPDLSDDEQAYVIEHVKKVLTQC